MSMRAENLRAFRTDRPVAKRGSFGGTRNDADVPGHTLILRKIVSVTVRELAESTGLKGRGTVAVRKVSRYWFRRNCGFPDASGYRKVSVRRQVSRALCRRLNLGKKDSLRYSG